MNINKIIVILLLVPHATHSMHRNREQEKVDQFANDILGIATNFYENLANAGIEAAREDAITERNIRETEAKAKADALKYAVGIETMMQSINAPTIKK